MKESAVRTLKLEVLSPAFDNEGDIPRKYTCDGEKISPPLRIGNIPHGTLSLALIAEDPDAPNGVFDHWVAWNIEPAAEIGEGENAGTSGTNGAGKTGYHPPCPPSGRHRYYFHVFALDTMLSSDAGTKKEKIKEGMKNHVLAKGTLMGYYQRNK